MPVVKNEPNFSAERMVVMILGRADFVPRVLHSSAAASSVSKRVRRSSKDMDMGMMGSPGECSLIQPLTAGRCLFFWRM